MFDSWPAVSWLQCVREEQLDLHTVENKKYLVNLYLIRSKNRPSLYKKAR